MRGDLRAASRSADLLPGHFIPTGSGIGAGTWRLPPTGTGSASAELFDESGSLRYVVRANLVRSGEFPPAGMPEQGGFYEALANGEYAKRCLKVTIVPGGPGVNVPQLVASGAVDMGIGPNSFIVMNLANAHAPVRAVAAFMQKDPQVLLAHPDAGVVPTGRRPVGFRPWPS